MKKYLEQILVAEILLFSGGIVFYQIYTTQTLLLFVFTSFLYYIHQRKKIPIENRSVLLFLILWIFLVQNVFIGERSSNRDLVYVLNPLGVFFILSSMPFSRFRNILLKQLTILSAISIIVQIGYVVGIFTPSPLTTLGRIKPYYMCFYFFNVNWGGSELSRLSSIYWEPGQFQIIIIFTLCLFVDQLRILSEWKDLVKKFGILVLALLMTFSTTGYIALVLLISCVLLFSNISRKEKLLSIFIKGLVAVLILFTFWNTDTVQDKLNQRHDISERTSYAIRMSDNLACLNITLSSPVYGYGIATKSLRHQLIMNESETSSNGWLYTSACLGIPYLLFLFICIYRRVKDMNLGIPAILIFAILIISQCNEYATFFPITYMYIFRFANYNKLKNETLNNNRNLQ